MLIYKYKDRYFCSHLKRCLRIKQQHMWETRWGFLLTLSLRGLSDVTFFCLKANIPRGVVGVMIIIIDNNDHKNKSHHYRILALYQALCWADHISFKPYSEIRGRQEIPRKGKLRLREVMWTANQDQAAS